jgi:DNA-binding response OmpR family regulator
MHAIREGAAEFFVKPFDRQVLLNRVRAVLDM